jgi:TolB-like protein/class 3 adenylate cyclase/Tfp pilus assembly protein PilF
MGEERAKRKLSGILSADAVGYSRLMEEDEAMTIRTLEDSKRLMSELIQQFKGRVVDAPGDNLLAEFGSVVDATDCAVKIQHELKAKNAALPDNRKMQFRIGVNLGDVVEEAARIYGDGINIAARIEGLAEPRGICISGTAYDHVKNKLELGYEYLGEHSVKNIAEPVRVYRVLMEPEAAGKVIGEKRFLGRISRRAAIAAIITLIVVAGGLAGWALYLYQSKRIEPASVDKMAYPLPDKPSIAVLPFDNLSGDPEQEYLCDGITEDIITALSKHPNLFVISRRSTFTYKGKPVKVQQVAEDLGVRYVLEGSIQRAGERLRITAQLIDGLKGHHVWSERYDSDMKDLFALQDKITLKVLKAFDVKLIRGEEAKLFGKGTDNLEVYLKTLQARNFLYQWMMEGLLGMSKSRKESLMKAIELCKKAISLDDSLPGAHGLLGFLYVQIRQYDKGIAECEKALELAPNSADAHSFMAQGLNYSGRPEEAIAHNEKAFRLNPAGAPTYYYSHASLSYFLTGRYEDTIKVCKEALKRWPNNVPEHARLAMAYMALGREEEARNAAQELLRIDPKFSAQRFAQNMTYKDSTVATQALELMNKAGLK